MKRKKFHQINRLKIFNIKIRKKRSKNFAQKIEFKRKFRKKWHAPLPKMLSTSKILYRPYLLKTMEVMKIRASKSEPCYLDFYNVESLQPDGAIYLYHQLDKLPHLKLCGRMSRNPTVKAMLTKLDIHQRMGLLPFKRKDNLVDRWLILTGDSADLESETYDEIENMLSAIVKSKKAKLRLQNAISEAVTNVVNHAYSDNDIYKRWVLFFCITADNCTIVISDLGKTIPTTVPFKLKDKLKHPATFWRGKKDSELIEVATTWRTTVTEENYRGKGFDDIIKVESIFDGSKVMVASRSGAWSSVDGGRDYDDTVYGTTVSWMIPVSEAGLATEVK